MAIKDKIEEDPGYVYVRACLEDIHSRAEGRALTEDEQTEFDAGLAWIDDARNAADRARLLDQVRSAPIEHREAGDFQADAFNVNRTKDPEDLYDISRSRHFPGSDEFADDLRSRAVQSLDDWDRSYSAEMKENAEHVIRHADREQYKGQVAAQVLRSGNPHYLSGFKKIVANPQAGAFTLDQDEQRAVADVMRAAMNEGTTTQGGFLVPPMLDPSIILTNNGVTNPFRAIATIKTIGTQTWKGVTSAGVTAEWTAEAAEVADATPTVAQPTITPVRADAYMQASMEMIQDTDITSEVSMLIADAKDRLEATAFAVGTGSTQPYGIVTELQLVTASRVAGSSGAAGAADFVVADVYAVQNALPPRHRPNASWLGEQTTWNKVRQFATGSGPQHAFWADLGQPRPPELLGRPVYETSEMDNTIVSGSNDDVIVYGDFKKYYIVDRIGLELVYNPLVLGTNRRPTGEVGWVAFWRVGARTVDANAFRMLRL